MTDWWSASIRLQHQMLDAQAKSIDAAAGLVAMQEAGRRAADAQLAAMQSWARLWGWK